jgi:hypothetical protein
MRKAFWASVLIMAATLAHAEVKSCVTGGCSKELCIEEGENVASMCLWNERYRCYQTIGKCERQQDGKCGWTQTDELSACFKKADGVRPPAPLPLK